MKNNPVLDAYIKRINRKLRTRKKQLKIVPKNKRDALGTYYILDTSQYSYGSILEADVDIESLGLSLGVKPIAEVKATTV